MRQGLKRVALIITGAVLVLVLSFLAVLSFPEPLFAHRRQVGAFTVFSDRPIPDDIIPVVADVRRRLATSDLYAPGARRKIFLCHDDWRFALLSEQFSSRMGGVADTIFTRNVYLGHADIPANALRLPGVPAARLAGRPLSYFIAHELTHQLEADAFGGALRWRQPFWLVEGYADHIGKAGVLDAAGDRARFLAGDRDLDPARSHLYRLYQLEVWALMQCHGRTISSLFRDPPSEAAVRAWLRGPEGAACVASQPR